MKIATLEYLEDQYRLAISDLKLATTQEQKDSAVDAAARVVRTITALYGCNAVDAIQAKYR